MPTLADLLAAKQPYILTVSPTARLEPSGMNLHRFAALVVMKDNPIVGIFTERDILPPVKAIAFTAGFIVQEVMTTAHADAA